MSLTSVIRYVRALDSSATDGSGKTGLAFGDVTAKYLVQGGTLTSLTTETITTLGTYQAPTDASHIRIKELSASDPCKGVYEVHLHNTQVASAGVKLWLFLSAAGAAFQPLELDLTDVGGRLPAALGANGNIKADVQDYLGTTSAGAAGYVGVDWSHVNAPTTAVSLSGTTISTSQAVASVTGAVGSVTGAVGSVTGNVGGNVTGSVGSVASGGITSASFAADSITASALAASAGSEVAAAVWDLATSGHTISGTFGAAMNAAGSAGDPLATSVPGSYGAGTAGYLLGTYLDASVSAVKAQTDKLAFTGGTLVQADVVDWKGSAAPAMTGDAFARLGAPAGASIAADVAAVKTDTGNLVTRITSTLFSGITSLAQWLGLLGGKQTGNSTARTELRATGAGSGTFDETTDSQEALRDRGDAAWATATGFALAASAPSWYTAPVDVSSNVSAIKAKTDNLPSDPAGLAALALAHGSGSWATATSVTVSDKAGFKLASDGLDAVTVESGLNARQSLSLIAAAAAGVLSGAATTTVVIAGAGVATTRVTATVDADGNRSSVVLSPPA
jgi:hypothetical protein